MYVHMNVKRLTIEIPVDQYEYLRKQAGAERTTVTAVLRRLIDDLRFQRVAKSLREDPFLRRRGSFDGPRDLAKDHDHYLYGK